MTNHAIMNLAGLINNDINEYEISDTGQLMPNEAVLQADGLRLAQPLDWELTVRNTGGDDDFILEGQLRGSALVECRRCLDDVEAQIETSFIYPMVYQAGKAELSLIEYEDKDDRLVFGKPEVDFTELLTQLAAIELPLTALCKEDCKGLSVDGVNLNKHPEHQAKPQDKPSEVSPFAVLKDFDV